MNWGKSITLVMIAFILFVVGLGIYMATNADSLFEPDYYQNGEDFTESMEREVNGQNILLDHQNGLLKIQLPDSGYIKSISLKNMGDATLDKTIKGSASLKQKDFNVELGNLAPGQWYVQVNGSMNEQPYLKKAKWMVP